MTVVTQYCGYFNATDTPSYKYKTINIKIVTKQCWK